MSGARTYFWCYTVNDRSAKIVELPDDAADMLTAGGARHDAIELEQQAARDTARALDLVASVPGGPVA